MKYSTISGFTSSPKLAFYVGWLILGIIQAWSTDLFHDEAFYWFCSQKLSWGYLEQPPMVSFLIYLGNLVIPNELGARIIFVLLNTLSIYALEKILKPKNFPLFVAIALSVGVLSIGGFLAMADNALIFFTATFFLLYKRYVNEDKFTVTLLLGVNIAGILYSKYYGLLPIFFVVASNISLFKRRSFYMIIAICAVLLLPAIFWQYNHGFISLKYHLFDNLSRPFMLESLTGFLMGQILITGPLIGLILLFASFRYTSQNKFENALKYTLVGTFVFFLLATFKFEVLPHWTSAAMIPMVLLSYKYLDSGIQLTKWVFYLFPINIVIVMGIRLYFIVDFMPQSWGLKTDYHKWDAWAQEMEEIGKGRPLVFLDDDIVKYQYYTGNTAYVLSNIEGRQTQYDLWDTEKVLQGKSVVLVSKNKLGIITDSIVSCLGPTYYYKYLDKFRSYSKIWILSQKQEIIAQAGESVGLPINLNSNYKQDPDFGDDGSAVRISYHVFLDGELKTSKKSNIVVGEFISSGGWMDLKIEVPDEPGSYEIRLSVAGEGMPPTINSDIIALHVEKPL